MMDVLKGIDPQVALGVLSRAALALEGANPAAKEIVEHEAELRKSLYHAACLALGISEANTPEDFERVADLLDSESDKLVGDLDVRAAYERLAKNGHLPSDLYDVQLIENMRLDFGERLASEEPLIHQTVHSPSREQHFGEHVVPGAPCLVSLFARKFRTAYPFKNFVMLVAGQRGANNLLTVAQAWRLYPSIIELTGSTDLVDYLRRFADHYGHEITIGRDRAKFFVSASHASAPPDLSIEVRGKRRRVNVARFQSFDPTTRNETASLVVAIDLYKYFEDLDRMSAQIITD